MPYNRPVKFTKTGQYGSGPDDEDDVYTVEEFWGLCKTHLFIDYDGFGHPVKGGMADESRFIKPSMLGLIPSDATHIVWYNR